MCDLAISEMESALIEHPAVAESAVTSSPDDKRGEVDSLYLFFLFPIV